MRRIGLGIFAATLALLAGLAPAFAAPIDDACRGAMRERLNLVIGLYRIELGASHMVGQVAAARGNPGRQQQLSSAEDGLRELLARLKSRAADVLPDTGAKGRCGADAQGVVGPIHAAVGGYFQTVDARWAFMERRLAELRRLPQGGTLSADPAEIDLWMREPLARYEVWRTLAQAATPKSEASSALYTLGMLTRFEWDTAVALRDAITPGGDPRPQIAAAAADAATLKRGFARPDGSERSALWAGLAALVAALPDSAQPPASAPQGGWPAWIGGWIKGYGDVFTRTMPTVLKGLEDAGL